MNPDFPPIPISWHRQYARYPIAALAWAALALVAIDMKVDRPEKMGSILEVLRQQKHIRK